MVAKYFFQVSHAHRQAAYYNDLMDGTTPEPWPRRVAWLAAAPAMGLLLYWRVPLLWFQNDDFAWLSLSGEARKNGMLHALFTPFAQGTVRVFGDRIYFLALTESLGLRALPFRICELATWAATIFLVALIGERLIGKKLARQKPIGENLADGKCPDSRLAGLVAALLWAANANAISSVAWASAYDQILCALCLLGAFYSHLRGWRAAEWILYLAGFGALEITVMYPFIAVLYDFLSDRKRVTRTIWLFAPAGVFAIAHFWLIPKPTEGPYAIALDSRLLSTIRAYLAWTFEPGSSALRTRAAQLHRPELVLGAVLEISLCWFAIRYLARREWLVGFFCTWFAAFLAPVLILPGHLTAYYLTLPSVGLAWLAGWGFASAWANGGWMKLAAPALALAYLVPSAAGVQAQTRWFYDRSQRMRSVIESVSTIAAAHPGTAIALEGVDDELYQAGFDAHPFPLFGLAQVRQFPGEISTDEVRASVASGRARVLEIRGSTVADVTEGFARQ